MGQTGSYPYCWAWCHVNSTGADGDFEMHWRIHEDYPLHDSCYFDDDLGRWVTFHELDPEMRQAIQDPEVWKRAMSQG